MSEIYARDREADVQSVSVRRSAKYPLTSGWMVIGKTKFSSSLSAENQEEDRGRRGQSVVKRGGIEHGMSPILDRDDDADL